MVAAPSKLQVYKQSRKLKVHKFTNGSQERHQQIPKTNVRPLHVSHVSCCRSFCGGSRDHALHQLQATSQSHVPAEAQGPSRSAQRCRTWELGIKTSPAQRRTMLWIDTPNTPFSSNGQKDSGYSWNFLNASLFAIVSWFYKLYTYCSVSDCLWRCCRALSRGQLDLNYGGSGASYRLKTVDLISPKLLVTMMRKTALLSRSCLPIDV